MGSGHPLTVCEVRKGVGGGRGGGGRGECVEVVSEVMMREPGKWAMVILSQCVK